MNQVITSVEERWEKGIPHHPESERLSKAIFDIDFQYNNDYFGWKWGGNGDNGEELMYLLDIYFESKDAGVSIV